MDPKAFEDSVYRNLAPHAPWKITGKKISPSTNTELKALAEQGAPHGTVLFADRQTEGRGRLGRSFYSPRGTGLYLSVLLRSENALKSGVQLTTVAAVAARSAIQEVCGVSAQIKWVNDLYYNGKKVCGILTEGSLSEEGTLQYAVCGAGFNVYPPEEGFPQELEQIAGNLCPRGETDLRPQLAAAFLNHLHDALERPYEEVLEEYRAHSLLTGKRVISKNGAFEGSVLVLGISPKGELLVREEDGTETALFGGEVSVALDE